MSTEKLAFLVCWEDKEQQHCLTLCPKTHKPFTHWSFMIINAVLRFQFIGQNVSDSAVFPPRIWGFWIWQEQNIPGWPLCKPGENGVMCFYGFSNLNSSSSQSCSSRAEFCGEARGSCRLMSSRCPLSLGLQQQFVELFLCAWCVCTVHDVHWMQPASGRAQLLHASSETQGSRCTAAGRLKKGLADRAGHAEGGRALN